nr:uncharacterized protein zgc:193726 [Nothobranchius furzeri]
MKSVLFSSMVAMMVMMSPCVSPGPLPAPPEHTRHNKSITESLHHFLDLTNFTRSDRHPNQTDIGFVRLLTPQRCFLSTCLTANLGSDLQRGDEKAGSLTTDPFGNGRK